MAEKGKALLGRKEVQGVKVIGATRPPRFLSGSVRFSASAAAAALIAKDQANLSSSISSFFRITGREIP